MLKKFLGRTKFG